MCIRHELFICFSTTVIAPGPPTALKTENPQKRQLTLRWSKPSLHGEDVQSYKVTDDILSHIFLNVRGGRENDGRPASQGILAGLQLTLLKV